MVTPRKPMIVFYLEEGERFDDLDYSKYFNQLLTELYDYYHKHGKHGFLSEKMSEENIYNLAKNEIDNMIQHSGSLLIQKCAIDKDNYLDKITEIENKKEFVRWYSPVEDQITMSNKVKG